jgi:hypothetical protein
MRCLLTPRPRNKMSNESNIFSKPLVWSSVFENVFRNVFAMNRSAYSVLGFEPGLVLDFDDEYYRLGEFQRQFSDAITHTRASTATYVDSTGTLQTAAINEPRVGHHVWNGSVWINEGLLHESEARTNLLLNSATLSTQSVTVTAVAHTLHFTGTGTITLSGVSTDGPLVGTGTGEGNRVSLTFTPTAGTLTLTVSGTVSNAQLEAAPTPSSYIPTSGSTVTRAADVLTIPAANLPWNPLAVSIQMDGRVTFSDENAVDTARPIRWLLDGSNYIFTRLDTDAGTGEFEFFQAAAGVVDNVVSGGSVVAAGVFVPFNIASRHGSTFINGAVDGTALTANTTPVALPDLSATNLQLGFDYNGTIRTFRIWAQDIGDAGLVEATEPSLVPSLSLTFDGTENSFIVEDWS